MPDLVKIPPPRGLARRGKRLWKDVTSDYVLRVDERILLETACKTLDLIGDLDAAMEGQPLIVKGSMGQERENPILSEVRQQRALLNRTLSQLKLPEDDAGRMNQHRSAAQSRWAATHGGL